MKRFYLLSLLLPILYSSQAQSFQIKVEDLGEAPVFSETFLMMNNIRTVTIHSSTEPKPGKVTEGSSIIQEFNQAGLMVQEVELTAATDTSRIASYFYNDNNILGWKQETDLTWGKVYRTGYRFLGEDQPYQERDYEMLANEQVMLLKTKQYTYTESGQLETILYKQGNQLVKSHAFTYSDIGQVLTEVTTNRAGDTTYFVEYAYYDNGSIQTVTSVEAGKETKTFSFVYDERGLPTTIEWTIDAANNGSIVYQYDQTGTLIAMAESSSSEPTIHRSFTYEKFETSSTVNLAER